MCTETLCWYCKNACGNCSWSDGTFTPIKGWTIDDSKKLKSLDSESYTVLECPEYKEFYKQLSLKQVANIIGISERSLSRMSNSAIKNKFIIQGKKLYISKSNTQRNFFLVNEDKEMEI